MERTIYKKKITNNIYSVVPGTHKSEDGIIFTTDIGYKESLELFLYDKDDNLLDKVSMGSYKLNSSISSVTLTGNVNLIYSYEYYADGLKVPDLNRSKSVDDGMWASADLNSKSGIYTDDFEWEEDKKPEFDMSEVSAYLLHVRGFTKEDLSIPKADRGTFEGITDKIHYLKDLGINQLILMPAYDFNEVIRFEMTADNIDNAHKMIGREDMPSVNYWGYCEAAYCALKNAYAKKDPISEFKTLVKRLHENKMELLMQFYFPSNLSITRMIDILRFWSINYHVDGFWLLGEKIPADIIVNESSLSDLKIYIAQHNTGGLYEKKSVLKAKPGVINTEFSIFSRRLVKSDEDTLNGFVHQFTNNPQGIFNVNYITINEGFTLYDLVSYDHKHNEDNHEDNRDGTDYNYSWNCGHEGPSRKKNIVRLRQRQLKNLLTMLLLSGGTPMLYQGDENLNTQCGNNNAYCQDNKTGHVDWKNNIEQREIHDFVKSLLAFRKDHPVLRNTAEVKMTDYRRCGYPDVSLHSEDAWRPRLSAPFRHIGIMYCGSYAANEKGKTDDYLYLAFNMHWENHYFALPKLPKGLKWSLEIYTGDEKEQSLIKKDLAMTSDSVTVPQRSIAVLKSTNS